MSLIGQPLVRREDPRMVRGEACYLDDIERPGMVHAVFVRSHHAHAAITAVRAPAAAPGLLAVITARELRGRVRPYPIGAAPGVEVADEPHPILAEDEVRYAGQPIAAVIATAPELAKDAAELVEVDYEPREPVLDPSRGIAGELELALDGTGRMLALRAVLTADLGAYLWTTTAIPPVTAGALLTGCYDIPAASVTVVGKRTHKVPTGPYRGAGRPDAAYLLERLVDDAARELGIDRVQLRRRNLIRAFPHATPTGCSYDSGDYERCLDVALELLGPASSDGPPGVLRGTGVALYVERAAGQWESAEAALEPAGRVSIASSASPHGQGHDITFAQIAGDRLGVDVDRVVLRFGDSDAVPRGVGTFGSRSTAVAGSAIVRALDQLIEHGRAVVAHALGVSVGTVEFGRGRFIARGRAMDWAAVARCAHVAERLPPGVPVGLRATARFDSEPVFASGAYAAAVEIDAETGKVTVRRVVAVDDAGTIINPLLAHGQVVGGAVQGFGECLTEEAIYDEDGQLRTATFMDYGLPTAGDVPDIVVGEVATPSPRNPLGAKGVGEAGTIGTLPAVANAVVDALAGRHLDPPYTPEKVWRSLRR